MEGARSRIRRERALTWEGAMLARMKEPPSFDTFVGVEKRVEPETFLKMRLAAAHKGMAVLTMAQWRESRGKP